MLLGQATNAQCAQPAAPQAGNGACDQFGAACRMWECPDAFDMGNGTWAFKWSDQVTIAMRSPAIATQHMAWNYPCMSLLLAQQQQAELAWASAVAECPAGRRAPPVWYGAWGAGLGDTLLQ